jgi:hypothetical protein
MSGDDAYVLAMDYVDEALEGGGALKGDDGKSAYQSWLDLGNTGTEEDFINSLKGADGQPGANGEKGDDGKSAYQYAQDGGYTGTETEFTTNIARSGVISKELEVERARINNLTTLQDGSTTGDAELIDARIDKDGNTYVNVGEHIRTVSSKISSDIGDLKNDLIFTPHEFEQGTIDSVTGENFNEAYMLPIRVRSFPKIFLGGQIKVKANNQKISIHYYYEDGSHSCSAWKTKDCIVDIKKPCYIRFIVANTDDSEITPNDIKANFTFISSAEMVENEIFALCDTIKCDLDITNKLDLDVQYGYNTYIYDGYFIHGVQQSSRSMIENVTFENDVIFTTNDGYVMCIYDVANVTVLAEWVDSYIIPKNTMVSITFKKHDNTDFVGNEDIFRVVRKNLSNSETVGLQYRKIEAFSRTLLINDNANSISSAIQGMCSDGENIWYFLSVLNVLKKYNIESGETTVFNDLDLGHGNDLTYNPNTGMLYCAYCEGNEPIVKTINTATMEVGTITLDVFDGCVTSIGYSKDLNKYVVVGGKEYMRNGNTSGWTRKTMCVFDENFDVEKIFRLPNDYSATQGLCCDNRYIYFTHSFYDYDAELYSSIVTIYDYNGKVISNVDIGNEEIESIEKVDDNNFYIATCHGGYLGGFVYNAVVSKESNVSILEVFNEYQIN